MKNWFRLNYPQLFGNQLCVNLHSTISNANYHSCRASEPDKDDSERVNSKKEKLTQYEKAVIRVNSEGLFCNDHIHSNTLMYWRNCDVE